MELQDFTEIIDSSLIPNYCEMVFKYSGENKKVNNDGAAINLHLLLTKHGLPAGEIKHIEGYISEGKIQVTMNLINGNISKELIRSTIAKSIS